MATSVATPLERRLGVIAGVNEMTSTSGIGSARINLQFELTRNIDSAAREVQAAISASRVDLPSTLKSNPTYRKANPVERADHHPGADVADPHPRPDLRRRVEPGAAKDGPGAGAWATWKSVAGSRCPPCASTCCRMPLNKYGVSPEDVRAAIQATNRQPPERRDRRQWPAPADLFEPAGSTGGRNASDYETLVVAWRDGAAVRLKDVARRCRMASKTSTRWDCSTASRPSSCC